MRSAPDGTLWVGNGDAASFNIVDPLALRTYDERGLAGKLMHVDRNGMGLPGHPFCPSNSNLAHNCTKLHAKGFRNPFRFALRPGGGITLGDVGWNSREEVEPDRRRRPELRLALLRGHDPDTGLPRSGRVPGRVRRARREPTARRTTTTPTAARCR